MVTRIVLLIGAWLLLSSTTVQAADPLGFGLKWIESDAQAPTESLNIADAVIGTTMSMACADMLAHGTLPASRYEAFAYVKAHPEEVMGKHVVALGSFAYREDGAAYVLSMDISAEGISFKPEPIDTTWETGTVFVLVEMPAPPTVTVPSV